MTDLSADELWKLRDAIDAILAGGDSRVGDHDIVLEYRIRLLTSSGVSSVNDGTIPMKSILHPRLLAEAPSRFENVFIQNVFTPVNADAYDLFENSNQTGNSLSSIKTHIASSAPGLQIPSVGTFDMLPGE